MKKIKLTQERLKELLKYNPKTGEFMFLKTRGWVKKGSIAGCLTKEGYVRLSIDNSRYLAHLLAWLYTYGYFPENFIDHINRIRHDNRISNLREASKQCNARNSKIRSTNNSGITGVSWNTNAKKWCAEVIINSKKDYLGIFSNLKDAAQARWDAEVKYGFPNCNTTSSALVFLNKSEV